MSTFMILPSRDPTKIRLLRVPSDYEGHEAFRNVTGLIAEVESHNPGCTWEDIAENLEEQGYEKMKFVLGPFQD